MKLRNKFISRRKFVILITFLLAGTLFAKTPVQLQSWLSTEPLSLSRPVFSTEVDKRDKSWGIGNALKFEHINITEMKPKSADPFKWIDGTKSTWSPVKSESNEGINLTSKSSDTPEITYLTTYIQAERWLKADLKIKTRLAFKVWLNDESVVCKESVDSSENITEKTAPIKLEKGVHKISIKIARPGNFEQDAHLLAWLMVDKKYKDKIQNSIEPTQYMDIEHLLYTPQVQSASMSADGDLFAVHKKHVHSPDNSEDWIEIRNYSDGSPVQTYRGGMEIKSFKWSPAGHQFSYTTEKDGQTTIWKYDLESGKAERILEDIEDLDNYHWTRNGENIIYSVKFKHPEEEIGVRRVKSLEDRQPYNRFDHYLYRVNIESGAKQRLTAGKLSTNLNALSPDGNRLIFSRHQQDYSQRPYSKNTYYILNLNNLSLDSLFTCRWLNSIEWAPTGDKLLITGGSSLFGSAGNKLSEDVVPNEYDAQAYIYNIGNSNVKPISLDFAPSINEAEWIEEDKIIFLALDRSRVNLFEYQVSKNTYVGIESDIEAINNFDFASNNSNNGIYYGTSANAPIRINRLKFGWRGKNELLLDPVKEYYKNVELSRVKRWTFNNKDGVEIEGRVYYPPEFDREKKYPCIVYYYGGTSPVSRNFDGRYPKNYWAANGYIVYVMQPSGATGFGQEFSAKHVNEWGTIVPNEIINGTKKFLNAHSFVDKNRLGCIGASYGGFTTEALITKTDMFSAAVSHAGISSIPGYWGEGYWGYQYGSVANATKYPWSDTDFFINNSAYFDAEKITTPLLLTHGTDDHNVPTGQSIQLYTALKILGKDVEFLRCADQGHWVLDYKKREKWTKSIVAWFDKWLKDQPEWWQDSY